MTAFFIDADNLCAPSWVEEACRVLEAHEGGMSVRRAYGSAEKLKGLGEVLRTRLIRPYMNLSLPKNTTDVAMAVDVMELSYATPRPASIAIGSGDADFVPLVLRLRERGFRVVCVTERGKMAAEVVYAYDKVHFVGSDSAAQEPAAVPQDDAAALAVNPAAAKAPAPVSPAARKPPAKKAAAKQRAATAKTGAAPVPAKKAPAKKASPAAKKAPASSSTAKSASAAPEQVTVRHILDHAPALESGQPQPLGEIARLLHDAKLLGKNAASTKLFKKFPHHFELLPTRQPNKVRYLLPPH
ncbi:NYN domain-containing protein [Paracidovorax anthurii]|uniref:NYN domain-containing protein n=1 Tax=Paracidovorax anthurii TaxID=78229 RepID=A0A328ZM78_9BURK|nr:NYN domain-containing protein [Paracidovorax anthurii]RAR85802.1 NYN domain-containing protein [Paracidovorax anthurii]